MKRFLAILVILSGVVFNTFADWSKFHGCNELIFTPFEKDAVNKLEGDVWYCDVVYATDFSKVEFLDKFSEFSLDKDSLVWLTLGAAYCVRDGWTAAIIDYYWDGEQLWIVPIYFEQTNADYFYKVTATVVKYEDFHKTEIDYERLYKIEHMWD